MFLILESAVIVCCETHTRCLTTTATATTTTTTTNCFIIDRVWIQFIAS